MGPTQIALLILGGVGLLALAAYFIQAAEDRKKARQLQLMHHNIRIRRAYHLFSNFPPLLASPSIQKFLTQYLITHCQAALQLEQSESVKNVLSEARQKAESPPEPAAHPEGSITLFNEPAGAQRARAIIKEFVKFIKEVEGDGEVSSNMTQPLLQSARECFDRTEADMELHRAQGVEEVNVGKSAFIIYKKTFIKLSELNKNHSLDWQLFELRNRMNKLAARIEKHNEEERERIRREAEENDKHFRF